MAGQLEQLAEISDLPNVSLRVAPFSAGLHPGVMSNSFVILRFPVNGDDRESEPATVYTDGFTGALYLDKPTEVDRYAQAFTGIWNACLDENRIPRPHPPSRRGTHEMSRTEPVGLLWRKSSYSNGQANCIEVATVRGEQTWVAIRDSKAADGQCLILAARAWRQLANDVRLVKR